MKVTQAYWTRDKEIVELVSFTEFLREARRVGRYAGLSEDEVMEMQDWDGFKRILILMDNYYHDKDTEFYPIIFVDWCKHQGYVF